MKTKHIPIIATIAVSLAVLSIAFAAQHRFTLTVPNGLAFSEFRGYDTWQDVAVNEKETSVKAILANPIMMKAFREGIPGNDEAFPEGAKIVKIEWIKKKNPVPPYFVEIPDYLKNVDLIEEDSERFPETNWWAYAQFIYDRASDSFKPSAPSATGHECGYACYASAKANDWCC